MICPHCGEETINHGRATPYFIDYVVSCYNFKILNPMYACCHCHRYIDTDEFISVVRRCYEAIRPVIGLTLSGPNNKVKGIVM